MSCDVTSPALHLLKNSLHHLPLQSPGEIQGLSFLQQHRQCSVSVSHQRHARVPFHTWKEEFQDTQEYPQMYHSYVSMILFTLPPAWAYAHNLYGFTVSSLLEVQKQDSK